jgi:flagellar M-ring protein FliF
MAANTETPAETPAAGTGPLDRLRQAFEQINSQQKILLAVAIAAMVALVVGTMLWSRQPDYKVLFSNLSERDGGSIIAALEQLNVPYKFTDGSGAILVPAERVHEVRLRLASQGLPKGGSVGFELMENQKFGISQFAEQVNYQRALEGELARTIQSISTVESARVHLAIPKPSVFVRQEQAPTASVLLQLYPGRSLDPAQVAGIAHLVSSSVPQLQLGNISIVDQNGNLLSQLRSPLTEAGLDPSQIKYVQEIENSIIKRIEDILTPVVGTTNLKVQVAADVDFSRSEQTAESYKPNTTPPDIAIRSQQTSETANINQAGPQGVPGALSNQPPVPATAPLTTPPVAGTSGTTSTTTAKPPDGQIAAAGITAPLGIAGQPVGTRKDSTINYEVDKTVRYTKGAIGNIRRLSAAVVVNQRQEADSAGKTSSKPLTDAEMKQINDLVRQAMGYSQDRGDTVSVVNAAFTAPGKAGDDALPIWKDPDNIDFAKDAIKYLVVIGVLAYLYFAIVRPLVRTMFQPPAGRSQERELLIGTDGAILPGQDGEGIDDSVAQYTAKVTKARDIAQKDPKVAANIIKDWLGANGG